MNGSLLKWIAGVASGLAVLATIALLNTWADVRQMKATLDDQKVNAIKAERIAALESDVRNLRDDVNKHDQSHSAMWQAIGRKADK